MTLPQWRIQLRDHSLVPLGELTDYIDGDLMLNFNDVGAWAMTVRADSPMAANFAAGNGVIISRDRGDGSGAQTILSGPIWHLERRLRDNTYVLAGPDDLWWLKARRADPVVSAPALASAILADTPLRYYKLSEPSGATATDSSASAQNGTYNGGITYAQASLVDDVAANTAILLNGSTGYLSAPNTSLPVGTNAWTIYCWTRLPVSNPGSTRYLFSYGSSNLANQFAYVRMLSTGQLQAGILNTTTGDSGLITPPPRGVARMYALRFNGTVVDWFQDGVLLASMTPTAPSIAAAPVLNFGALTNNASTWTDMLDECVFAGSALSDARIAQLYALGRSHYAGKAYDTRTNTASTVIRGYVNDNAGPGAVTSRQVFGLALAADPAIGSSVTGNARFDNLLALLQQLAISGGDIGFTLKQTDVGALTFTIYQPVTQSNAIFSRELGNLLDATYTLDGPTANQYVIGGGGEGTLRVIQAGQDTTAVNTWGLVEGFIDARDTSEVSTLQQRNSAQLAQDKQKTNLSITPTDTAALQFGRDYGIGDIVNVQIDGATITDKIRQLHIKLTSAEQELVTPGIGNAGAGQIAELFDARSRALASVSAQVARLQTAR